MSQYNIVPPSQIKPETDVEVFTADVVLRSIYQGVKCKVYPCVIHAPKDLPEELLKELQEAGYRIEITPWNKEKNQWRVFWDFDVYRTVEKNQDDTKTYLDIYEN